MSDTLRVWITQKIEKRGWSYRELARQANISHALISRTLSGDMTPSADFCIKVAQALDVSPEMVLRLAGILPAAPPATLADDAALQELVELARTLSSDKRKELLRYTRYLLQSSQDE